jgi:hypothetical protein
MIKMKSQDKGMERRAERTSSSLGFVSSLRVKVTLDMQELKLLSLYRHHLIISIKQSTVKRPGDQFLFSCDFFGRHDKNKELGRGKFFSTLIRENKPHLC